MLDEDENVLMLLKLELMDDGGERKLLRARKESLLIHSQIEFANMLKLLRDPS